MTKKIDQEPIVAASGRVFEKVWRIKHMPSGAFFKPGGIGFSTTEGRLAKTYSRKPSLSILGTYPRHDTGRVEHYVHLNDIGWRPHDEFKVVEYMITESGTVYDK
jgi:hypothetical protein